MNEPLGIDVIDHEAYLEAPKSGNFQYNFRTFREKIMMRSIRALSVFGVIILAGCGGGGGGSSSSGSSSSGSSSPTTPVAVQMQSSLQKFAQAGTTSNFTISGWIGQNGQQVTVSGNGTVNISPQQSNGSVTTTVSAIANGTALNETLAVSISYSAAPLSVVAGDSGTIGNASYSVAADGANSLLITINAPSNSGPIQNQLQSVYKVDTAGNVTPVSLQDQEWIGGVEVADLTLTF